MDEAKGMRDPAYWGKMIALMCNIIRRKQCVIFAATVSWKWKLNSKYCLISAGIEAWLPHVRCTQLTKIYMNESHILKDCHANLVSFRSLFTFHTLNHSFAFQFSKLILMISDLLFKMLHSTKSQFYYLASKIDNCKST